MSVYKLYCKDPTITDFYIGSSKDMDARKKNHNYICYKINEKNYNIKLYKKIRETGFDNWDFEILEKVEYKKELPVYYLEILERKWYDELKPTLNMVKPYVSDEEFKELEEKKKIEKITCEHCNCKIRRDGLSAHNKTKKHIKRCRELSG